MEKIYLDNSATTAPCEQAVRAAEYAMTTCYGNPSSKHQLGTDAAGLVSAARKNVSSVLGCASEELFFTASGTTANNTAIFGAYEKLRRSGNRIVTTSVEHASVEEPLKRLEAAGVEVIRLRVGADGKIDENELFNAVTKDTILVSIMAVNNEVGAIEPTAAARRAVKRSGSRALVHVDAVQAFGKIDVRPSLCGADMISVSAHKIHGIKGVGALYIKKGTNIKPYVLGGGQENNMFSGTEAVPAIAAFGAAALESADAGQSLERLASLRDGFVSRLRAAGGFEINSPDDALPYIINISVTGCPSEPVINALSQAGVYISAGSACKKGHRSHVLTAMGISPERADCAVRISLSRSTTREELDFAFDELVKIKDRIKR
ncbi:MAG: cysteine desulfurase [Clostridiales bacterium]|nr:cysteine desulfurase [Clostridiales bacterium]